MLLVLGALLLARFVTWSGRRITERIDAASTDGDALVRSEAAKHRGAVAQVLTWLSMAVIWSVGARSAAANAHETENLNNNRIFVSRQRSDMAGSEFDDIVTWIPMTVVISRMVAGGQLP